MAHNVIMPKSGMAMEEGTIVRWLKAAGDSVRKGEAIAVIETDKVTMDLESDFEGTLLAILHGDGTVVKATETIAWVGAPGEKIPSATAATAPAAVIEKAPPATVAAPVQREKVPATPAARARAAEKGIALSAVAGTGPGGAVRLKDLPGTTASRQASQPATLVTLVTRADVTELTILRARVKESGREALSCLDFVAKAAAAALPGLPTGMTFAVTDLGIYGITQFTPNLPDSRGVAIGLGAIEDVLRMGPMGVESRKVMSLCLTYDPGLNSSETAAAFLAEVRGLLENCYLLLA
jgi:pyruvate/2-oxoglutarate dehydrogenase complex dihydrolipoamide acyltransferase (E2) component